MNNGMTTRLQLQLTAMLWRFAPDWSVSQYIVASEKIIRPATFPGTLEYDMRR